VTFSAQEAEALSREIDASASLLRHGFAILADPRFAFRDSEPLFACLAGGAEKLLKLPFGLLTVETATTGHRKPSCETPDTKLLS